MTAVLASLVVLMYHRVAPDVPKSRVGAALTVSPQRFEQQLDLLARERIRVYTADEAARAIGRGERVDGVVLSFDDGRVDGFDVVLPALRRHRMHASFYVNSSTIDAPFHMTWRDLRALRAAGDEIGCHGHEHVDLAQLDEPQQRYQIVRCQDLVQQHVGVRPRTYAYASGRYDDVTRMLMLELDVDAALTEIPGAVEPGVDPTQWPRRRVTRETTDAEFAALIDAPVTRPERSGTRRARPAASPSRRTRPDRPEPAAATAPDR